MNTRSARLTLPKLVSYLVLIIGAGVVLVPFIWMMGTSLKPHSEVFIYPPRLLPRVWYWRNWIEAPNSSYVPLYIYVRNSLIICLPVVVLDVFVSAAVAFGFARIRFRGSRLLFFVLLSTMMLPGQVTMIPMFIIFSRLNWVNTFLPLIVPAFFGWPYAVFLLRQFFATVSDQLDDAARIDGCGVPGIFWYIHLPLARPALGIVAIFSFTGMWSEYFRPLIYLRDTNLWPMSLALQTYLGRTSRWEYVMVMSALTSLPPVLLFILAQRSYVQGIVITGVKG
jgi:multiple sugar transport system permease protein